MIKTKQDFKDAQTNLFFGSVRINLMNAKNSNSEELVNYTAKYYELKYAHHSGQNITSELSDLASSVICYNMQNKIPFQRVVFEGHITGTHYTSLDTFLRELFDVVPEIKKEDGSVNLSYFDGEIFVNANLSLSQH